MLPLSATILEQIPEWCVQSFVRLVCTSKAEEEIFDLVTSHTQVHTSGQLHSCARSRRLVQGGRRARGLQTLHHRVADVHNSIWHRRLIDLCFGTGYLEPLNCGAADQDYRCTITGSSAANGFVYVDNVSAPIFTPSVVASLAALRLHRMLQSIQLLTYLGTAQCACCGESPRSVTSTCQQRSLQSGSKTCS